MRNIFWNTLSLLILALCLVYCKRNTPEINGPTICPSANFLSTGFSAHRISDAANTSTIDFSGTDGIAVQASFNEEISWTLVMRGTTSGASRTFTGRSNAVNVLWYGDSQTEQFFQNGETISILLNASCKEEPIGIASMAITANGITSFQKVGALISNFNNGIIPGGVYGQTNNLEPAPNASGMRTSASTGYVASPQGANYYNISGRARSASTGIDTVTWYFGGFDLDFTSNTAIVNSMATLNEDPSQVYLNCFISSGGVPNSQMQLTIKERYGLSTKERKVVRDVTWTGWKMVSFKMSDLGIIDPREIKIVSYGLGASSVPQHLGQLNVDLVLFTNNAPLQH
ncbi:MAG: hypothetical protein K0R51_2967 [Cytophagaceae bacterium]|jgi:hypothetical protein|nr:hypothetical protein [Cytophagaceae bacterium]